MLVTSALPYANGAPHIGHVVEYVYSDIWVRYQKLLATMSSMSARATRTARRPCSRRGRRTSPPRS